ncbi:MAG: tetratricopeptide repeat protein [Firmicutes bacterium]|nr:tetratricopeptide repeat protein [Bacillota bacterium]
MLIGLVRLKRGMAILVATAVFLFALTGSGDADAAETINVQEVLKQIQSANARIRDLTCILESVHNRGGVEETVTMQVVFKRPDKYHITYLAPEANEGTRVILAKGAGVVVPKTGHWKAYDSMSVAGLETLAYILRFVRDSIADAYDVRVSERANIKDRVAYVLTVQDKKAPWANPDIVWVDNIKSLVIQAQTSAILGEPTLLRLGGIEEGEKGDWKSYILTVTDLRGDRRGEITLAQVEKGVFLPTRVELFSVRGRVEQVLRDVRLNTGVKDDLFVVKEAEEMRAKIKEAKSAQSRKKYDQAIRAYLRAIELDPENIEARCELGLCYWYSGDAVKAVKELEAVLELNPDYLPACNNLGFILADTKLDLKRAISLLEKAVDREPANPVYMDSLGWAYFKQGRVDDAERTIRRALLFSGNFPERTLATAHYHLAMVCEAKGMKAEAIEEILKALDIDPGDAALRQELARLKKG